MRAAVSTVRFGQVAPLVTPLRGSSGIVEVGPRGSRGER